VLTLARGDGALMLGGSRWTIGADAAVLRDGVQAAGGTGKALIGCDHTLYVWGTDEHWWRWTGDTWAAEPEVPPELVAASAPSSLAWNGWSWTIGPWLEVLRDGVQVEGGTGTELRLNAAGLSVKGTDGQWWVLSERWVAAAVPPMEVRPPTSAAGPGVQALSAAAFVESVGVTTHLNYVDTAYYTRWPAVRDLLLASKIRHVREGIPRMAPWYYDRLRAWHNGGVRFLAMLGKATVDDFAALVQAMPNIAVIEGLNEWDLNGGPTWVADLRRYQSTFYDTAQAWGLMALGPSLTSQAAFEAVGDLSADMDTAQVHNYYSTRHPETTGWGADGYGSLDWSRRMSAIIAPGKAVWTVETGYPCDPGHEPRMPDRDMPAAACVRYVSRLLVEQFAQGIGRTYLYQFVEDFQPHGPVDGYATHGLVRADGTPKATYWAVQSLLHAASSGPVTPGTLAYTLTAAHPDVRQVLLHKADGTFLLVVWLALASMDPDTRHMRPGVSVAATLTLPKSHRVRHLRRLGDDGRLVDVADLVVSEQLTLIEIEVTA
jgi:hypothetical protein